MTRGAAITVENNFSQGLITEFTAMNFPENAITEGDNCIYSELGRVERRNGMDREILYTDFNPLGAYTPETNATVEFSWHSVSNDGTIQLHVEQMGYRLFFYSISTSGSLSAGKKPFFIDLKVFRSPGSSDSEIARNECSFTYGKGYLFVTHPNCEPFYVKYNKDTDTVTAKAISLETRDFQGVEDGLETQTRPSSLSSTHKYNLFNQGWYLTAVTDGTEVPGNVLTRWDEVRDDYPSNADIWWLYKNAQEIAYFGENQKEGMIGPSQVNMGNTPAAKGHYIYNTFNINRTSKSGIGGLPTDTAGPARPSAVCWFAGRVFYAGVAADGYSDKIYFTQIIESDEQFGKCYQVNDPTSETIFDLLDTDGGVLSLPLMEKVVAMKVIADTLVVIGTNSVYSIRGTDNGPFRATDYTVEYVSSIGGRGAQAIVPIDSSIMWINYDGIYLLSKDQIGVYFQVQNVSKQTIQSVIDSIPVANRDYIKGAYNKKEQKIQWVFSDRADITGYQYNRILELNLASKAFWTHTIDTSVGARIAGIMTVAGQRSSVNLEAVSDNLGVTVTTNSEENVDVQRQGFIPDTELFKYPVWYPVLGMSFAELWRTDYIDFHSYDLVGATYLSYGVSGYRIRGEFLRAFNSTPIAFVIENLDDGSVLVDGIWDYGARTTTSQELYNYKPDVSYQVRRVKLRGKGRSLQIRYRSQGQKPFSLIGWATFDTGGTLP